MKTLEQLTCNQQFEGSKPDHQFEQQGLEGRPNGYRHLNVEKNRFLTPGR